MSFVWIERERGRVGGGGEGGGEEGGFLRKVGFLIGKGVGEREKKKRAG